MDSTIIAAIIGAIAIIIAAIIGILKQPSKPKEIHIIKKIKQKKSSLDVYEEITKISNGRYLSLQVPPIENIQKTPQAFDRYVGALWRKSRSLEAMGEFDQAIKLWRKGLEIYERILTMDPRVRESCKAIIGRASLDLAEKLMLQSEKNVPEARKYCRRAVELLQESVERGVSRNLSHLHRAERLLKKLTE